MGSCLTLGNELSNETHVLTKQETLLGRVAKSSPTLATPWTVAHQAPLSMGFPSQEYWSGLPFPSLRDLPDSGIKPESLESPASGRWILLPTEPPGKPVVRTVS